MDESKPKTEKINCPFLRMVQPEADNIFKFASECQEKGDVQYMTAFIIASKIVNKQQGWRKALQGYPPDIWRLDQVEGVSHTDKYQNYLEKTDEMLEEKANDDGVITFKDLIDVKKWIAEQEKVEVIRQSQIFTTILFIKSGGDLDSMEVKKKEIMTMLDGKHPENEAHLNLSLFKKGMEVGEQFW